MKSDAIELLKEANIPIEGNDALLDKVARLLEDAMTELSIELYESQKQSCLIELKEHAHEFGGPKKEGN